MLKLKAVQTDKGYVLHQQKLFERITAETDKKCQEAKKMNDIDLEEHHAALLAKEIVDTDWNPFAQTDITPNSNFISELMERFTEDLLVRQKEVNFGTPPPSTLLRKLVRLEDIHDLVGDLHVRTLGLHEESMKLANKLEEEARLKEIEETSKRLLRRKLDFEV